MGWQLWVLGWMGQIWIGREEKGISWMDGRKDGWFEAKMG